MPLHMFYYVDRDARPDAVAVPRVRCTRMGRFVRRADEPASWSSEHPLVQFVASLWSHLPAVHRHLSPHLLEQMASLAPHVRSLRTLVNALDRLVLHPGDDAAHAAALRAARRMEPSLARVQLQLPEACPALLIATRVLEAEPLRRLLERLAAHGMDAAATAPAWADLPPAQQQRISTLAARQPRGAALPDPVARVLARPGAGSAAGGAELASVAWHTSPERGSAMAAAAAAGSHSSPASAAAGHVVAHLPGVCGAAEQESAEEALRRVLRKLREVEEKRRQAAEEREEHVRAVHERQARRRPSPGYRAGAAVEKRGAADRASPVRGPAVSAAGREQHGGGRFCPPGGRQGEGEASGGLALVPRGEDEGGDEVARARPGSLISPEAIRAHVRARVRAKRESLERAQRGGLPDGGERGREREEGPRDQARDSSDHSAAQTPQGGESEDDSMDRGLQSLQVVHDMRMSLLAQLERHRAQARECEEELKALEELGGGKPAAERSRPPGQPASKGDQAPVVRELTLGDLLMAQPEQAAAAPRGGGGATGAAPRSHDVADAATGASADAGGAAGSAAARKGGDGAEQDDGRGVPAGPLDPAFFDLSPFEAALQ